MVQRYLVSSLLLLFVSGLMAQTASPLGKWRTIDDATGETRSVIEIYETDGKYAGRIAEIISGDSGALCDACEGALKNKPILGMVIIENLGAKGDHWSGGTILDPENGSTYKLSAWFEEDPAVLFIRGKHWTGLYRTQRWLKQE